MNKQEFISTLTKELAGFQEAEAIDDIITDFNEHFDEAVRAGKSEDEVCKMLGDPSEIAAQCKEEISNTTDQPTNIVNDSDSKKSININLYHTNLVCQPCHGDQLNVQIMQNRRVVDDDNITVMQKDGSWEIIQNRPKEFMQYIFHMFEHKTVYINIPMHFDGNINIKLASGNVKIEDLKMLEGIDCNVTSGNIKIYDTSTRQLLLAASRWGNVALDRCQGDARASSTSGNIKIRSHKGTASGVTSSGNVDVETDCITKDAILETKSGNIHLELEKLSANLELSCISGNIKLAILEILGNITGKTTSGNITARLDSRTKAFFMLQSSGIHNDFSSIIHQEPGIPTISLRSKSGNVKVKRVM